MSLRADLRETRSWDLRSGEMLLPRRPILRIRTTQQDFDEEYVALHLIVVQGNDE